MANVRDFNPRAVLVVRSRRGLKVGGRLYEQGAPVADDCLSMRKRQQLFAQNYLCYPHDLDAEVVENAKVVDLNEQKEDKKSEDVKPETGNGDDAADKSEEKSEDKSEVSNTQEGEGESSDSESAEKEAEKPEGDDNKSGKEDSSESSEPVVKKKRARKPKS